MVATTLAPSNSSTLADPVDGIDEAVVDHVMTRARVDEGDAGMTVDLDVDRERGGGHPRALARDVHREKFVVIAVGVGLPAVVDEPHRVLGHRPLKVLGCVAGLSLGLLARDRAVVPRVAVVAEVMLVRTRVEPGRSAWSGRGG